MKMKRFLSLVISAAMALSTFGSFAVTSASAEVGDASNNIWTASAADADKQANSVLYDDAKGTLTTMFDMTLTTEVNDEALGMIPVSETVGERTFSAYVSHPNMNGGWDDKNGTTRSDRLTMFKFVPKADGVLTVYFRNVGTSKAACILKDGTTNFKSTGTETSSIVYRAGKGISADYSAQLVADQTYYMFVDGSKGQFMAVDYEVGATYEQPTPEPATPKPTIDPNSKSWTVSEDDIGRKAGDMLMGGLTLVSDNSSTSKSYVTAVSDGKIETTEDGKAFSGSALKFVAPEDGKLEVTMIDCGGTNDDGSIKSVTPVIYGVAEKANLFEYTTKVAKEKVELSADVTGGNTYYITATGTKGRFSAAKFTPASQGGDATTAPDVTSAPDTTAAPVSGGITYKDGTVTVKADNVTTGLLIIASYNGTVLTKVETKPLAFTNGTATVSNLALTNGTKLMAWNNLNDMEPICPSYTVSGSSVTQAPATTQPTREPISVPEETEIAQVPTGSEAVYIGETKYNTITEALAAAPTAASEAERVYIDIMPGVYREQIKVTKPYITFRKKAGTDGNVKLTWYYGQGSTYYSCKDGFYTADKQATGGVPSNWGATLNVPKDGLGFIAENLILENSYNRYYTQEELTDLAGHDPGEGNSNFKRLDWLQDQIAAGVSDDVINTKLKTRESDIDGKYDGAGKNTKYSPRERCAALYTNADKIQIKNCVVISTQDTIGINDNRVYFENCRLGGTTDYICGSAPGAVFNNCELYTNAGRDGEGATITAPSNRANTNGYLFWNCRINGTDTAIDGSMGRPWSGDNAGAAYINTVIETSKKDSSKLLVGAAGWSAMSGNKPEDAHFHEFGSIKEDGTPVDVSKRVQGTVLGEWEVLAYNPYKFLKGTDDWDPMGVKEIWTKVQEDVNAVTIADSDTIKKQDDGSYEVSGEFTLPDAPAGYDIHFESDSEYLNVNGNKVTAVRPITGTSEGALIVYLRKTDDKTTGASAKINITITADQSVDPAAFTGVMADAKAAITALMGSEETTTLDRAVPVPTIADKDDVKTTIKLETADSVNADGTIARNPYASEMAEGKVTYVIECRKGDTILREKVTYNVTIPSKKGDLLYADFEDNATSVGGTIKADGNNSSYYVNGAISANFAKASSKSPVTVEFDVKKADTTVTVGKYTKTVAASAMQDGWNKVKLVIDTAAKTITTSVNGTALGEAETVAEGEASVSKLTLTAGDYDNITVFEGENNADGAKVYTTMWKASEADNGKPTGSILMRGMTVTDTITTLKAASDTVDGETFTHFVSSGNNGSYKNNKFSGTGIGLKLVAPADGKWTVYVTGLKTKTFAVGSNEDATVTKTTTGTTAGIATSLTIDVESGKTYYATVDGSKGSFLGAKFVPTVEGGAAEEPEKPIENAISIKIKLTNGNFLTEEEKTNKTAVSFGVNKDGARVAADAADALVVFNNVKYHSDDHGFNPGTATIKVPSYTRVSVGGCNWGSDVKLKVNGADYATESSKIACWNENNNSVAELYYKEAEEATLEISGGGYWPYIAFESITEKQLPNDVTATFELGSSDAQGVVPDKKTVIKGAKITIPANRTLYKEGNTLTGWTDGTNTYTIGQEVTLTDNMTLTPVFTANTKTVSDTSVTFDFQRQNGAPTVGWENVSGKFWVGQATVDGTQIDVKMDIDTTQKTLHDGTTKGNGKVANANWVDWAQINQCTEFTVPAVAGAVIEIAAMGADTKLEIGANQFNKDAGYTVKAEDITDGKVKMLNVGGGYTRTIKVTYPAATAPTETTAPTTAPVVTTAPTTAPVVTTAPTSAPIVNSEATLAYTGGEAVNGTLDEAIAALNALTNPTDAVITLHKDTAIATSEAINNSVKITTDADAQVTVSQDKCVTIAAGKALSIDGNIKVVGSANCQAIGWWEQYMYNFSGAGTTLTVKGATIDFTAATQAGYNAAVAKTGWFGGGQRIMLENATILGGTSAAVNDINSADTDVITLKGNCVINAPITVGYTDDQYNHYAYVDFAEYTGTGNLVLKFKVKDNGTVVNTMKNTNGVVVAKNATQTIFEKISFTHDDFVLELDGTDIKLKAKPTETTAPAVTTAPTSAPTETTAPTTAPAVTTAPTSAPAETTAPTTSPVVRVEAESYSDASNGASMEEGSASDGHVWDNLPNGSKAVYTNVDLSGLKAVDIFGCSWSGSLVSAKIYATSGTTVAEAGADAGKILIADAILKYTNSYTYPNGYASNKIANISNEDLTGKNLYIEYTSSTNGYVGRYDYIDLYKNIDVYNITVPQTEGGTVTVPTKAVEGQQVYVKAEPENGKVIETLKAGELNIAALNNDTRTQFTMPANDVTITASFKAANTITANQTERGGEIKLSATSGQQGDVITITPKYHYGYNNVTYAVSDGAEVTMGEGGVGTFTLGNTDVTVTPTFILSNSTSRALFMADGTVSGTCKLAVKGNINELDSVKDGATVTYENIDFTKLQSVDVVKRGNAATMSILKGESSVGSLVSSDATKDAGTLVMENAFKPDYGNDRYDYTIYRINITESSGTDALKFVLSNTESSKGYLGNYRYLILNYAE